MQITRNSIETMAGPSDWFTGSVYVDSIAAPSGASRASLRPGGAWRGAHVGNGPGSRGRLRDPVR